MAEISYRCISCNGRSGGTFCYDCERSLSNAQKQEIIDRVRAECARESAARRGRQEYEEQQRRAAEQLRRQEMWARVFAVVFVIAVAAAVAASW